MCPRDDDYCGAVAWDPGAKTPAFLPEAGERERREEGTLTENSDPPYPTRYCEDWIFS